MIDHKFGVLLGPMSSLEKSQPYEWRNDPSIYKWCRQYEPLDYTDHLKWFDSLPGRKDIKMYAIWTPDQKFAVGVCGLTDIDLINRKAEFSLYIAPDYQKRGYGEAALNTLCMHGFYTLGLQHIFGETFDGNLAAKMFEKVGFKKEGTRRKFYFRDGAFIDAHLYSMLLEEYVRKWKLD